MKKVLVVAWMLSLTALTAAFAQKPAVVVNDDAGWHKIGEISASFKTQNESIAVLGADHFDAIKLKVTDAPINIQRVQVFYESGEMQDIDVQSELQAGAESRTIALTHHDDIKKVAFTYKTLPNYRGEKAHVELHGYKANEKSDQYRRDEDGKSELEKTEEEIDKGTRKIGDKISETAGKAEGEIFNRTYEGKVGPDGQTIYIDDHDKYYYVNEKGKRVYVTALELRDKPKKKDQ